MTEDQEELGFCCDGATTKTKSVVPSSSLSTSYVSIPLDPSSSPRMTPLLLSSQTFCSNNCCLSWFVSTDLPSLYFFYISEETICLFFCPLFTFYHAITHTHTHWPFDIPPTLFSVSCLLDTLMQFCASYIIKATMSLFPVQCPSAVCLTFSSLFLHEFCSVSSQLKII